MYTLEKPNISGITLIRKFELLHKFKGGDINKLMEEVNTPSYLYWDKIKHKKLPPQITHEEFWAVVKLKRELQSIPTVIKNEVGVNFSWNKTPSLEEFLHNIDLHAGGSLFISQSSQDEERKQEFISRGIIEEAIASSQLEGAVTSRKVAKKFLREGRAPKNDSEQMILNNHESMKIIETEYKNKKIDLDSLFELHSLITNKTIPNSERMRLRNDSDEIVVKDKKDPSIVYHIPPKEAFLEKELVSLLSFMNDETGGAFIHPVIKAILVHFWVGYLHPFTDGNGRLARLLFYWYLLSKGYWAFSYLPISVIIKNSSKEYQKAFVYSEQDDSNLTYFIDYKIRKIQLAMKKFEEYYENKSRENSRMNLTAKQDYNLNGRQIQLLQYLYSNKDEHTSYKMYKNIYKISNMTVVKDLKSLQKLGFIESERKGRNVYYSGTGKIGELFS